MYYVLLILLHLHTTNQRGLGIRSANFRPILPIFFWEWALSMHVFHSSRLQLGENIYEGAFSFSGTTFQQLQWDRLSKSGTIPGPVLDFDRLYRPVSSLGKILSLSCCPFVPGQWRNFCPIVPKSCPVPLETLKYTLYTVLPEGEKHWGCQW